MSCFTNFFSVRTECGPDVTPNSGLYINDLPGISIQAAGEFSSTQKSGYNALLQSIDNGINDAKAELFSYLDHHMRALPFLEVDGVGEWANSGTDSEDYGSAEASTAGVEVCMYQPRSANLRKIYISTIDVLTNSTVANKTLTISDRNTDTVKTFNLTAGAVTTIDVYQQFDSDKVYINWSLADIDFNNSTLAQSNCTSCRGSYGSWKGYKDYKYAYVRGRKGSDTGQKETYGIRVNFRIQCDREGLLCRLREEIKYILWYRCGLRVIEDMLTDSGRFNAIAMTERDKLEEARNILLVKLYGDQSEASLRVGNRSSRGLIYEFGRNLASVGPKIDSECIRCNTSRFAVQRP